MFPQPALENWQIWTAGVFASILVIILTWLIEKVVPWILALFKVKVKIDLSRTLKTIFVGAVALGLAYWWFPFSVPAWPELIGDFSFKVGLIWQWLMDLLTSLTPYLGAATLLYNVVIGYFTDPARRSEAFQKLFAWLISRKLPIVTYPVEANYPTGSDETPPPPA